MGLRERVLIYVTKWVVYIRLNIGAMYAKLNVCKKIYSSQVYRLTIRKFLYIHTKIKHVIKWLVIIQSSLLIVEIASYKDKLDMFM